MVQTVQFLTLRAIFQTMSR